jgi:transcriptional regulator with GAF, ATPase, and Fis domain
MIRRFDLERSQIETLAVAARNSDGYRPAQARTECSSKSLEEILSWARTGGARRGRARTDSVLALLAPDGWAGECLAGPLRSERTEPIGVVVLLGPPGAFTGEHAHLLDMLLEALSVALVNYLRVHELVRLREAAEADRQALLSRLQRSSVVDALVGGETGLRDVMERVDQVAPTDVPVLLLGETGTGKEVIARELHARSRRAAGPIVRVNCGAIPQGLLDSELFGHERGSFTGAVASRQGWFERADGGTLFLDEIGELPLDAQVRFLRILQEGTFERVGGQRTLTVDVRIVAATNRDLKEMVASGTFREDLWYRVSIFPIWLPPLRERLEDIPLLAAHFAWRVGQRLGGNPLSLTPRDTELLLAYPWPGNVRELAAVMERAAILGGGRELHIAAALGIAPGAEMVPMPDTGAPRVLDGRPIETWDDAQRRCIEAALAFTRGRVEGASGAAQVLEINAHTLRARMRKLGIDWAMFRRGRSSAAGPRQRPSSLADTMRAHVERALKRANGRVEGTHGAAALLDVNPYTLRARMRKLGVSWAGFRPEPTRPSRASRTPRSGV